MPYTLSIDDFKDKNRNVLNKYIDEWSLLLFTNNEDKINKDFIETKSTQLTKLCKKVIQKKEGLSPEEMASNQSNIQSAIEDFISSYVIPELKVRKEALINESKKQPAIPPTIKFNDSPEGVSEPPTPTVVQEDKKSTSENSNKIIEWAEKLPKENITADIIQKQQEEIQEIRKSESNGRSYKNSREVSDGDRKFIYWTHPDSNEFDEKGVVYEMKGGKVMSVSYGKEAVATVILDPNPKENVGAAVLDINAGKHEIYGDPKQSIAAKPYEVDKQLQETKTLATAPQKRDASLAH